jgi:hypothetical protein
LAPAQVVLSPVAVITDIPTYDATVPVTNMINQSGITTPFASGVTVFDTYFANPGQKFATSGNGGTNNWQSEVSFNLPLKGNLDFDLGAVYRLNKLGMWNRSLKDITVKVLMTTNGPEQVVGDFALISRLNSPFSYAADVLTFPTNYQGRYVRLAINSVHTFSPGDTFGYAIVGEVVLSAVPVGPAAPSPTVNIALKPNGDVEVNFTGTLQSSTNVLGGFDDVPGNPSSPHTLSRSSLLPQQYFRARGN